MKIGYKDLEGTPSSYEGLASEVYRTRSITIKQNTIDPGNDSTADLRKYMVLGYDSTTEMYEMFDATTHDSGQIVVLGENLYDMTEGNQVTHAFWQADFLPNILITNGESVTWDECQRISIVNG